MNRYLLSAILIASMAHGMDAPKSNTDDLNLLQDLIVKIHSEASGHERQNLASQIIALRRKLGIKNLYQDLPLGSYERTPVLDAISNQMASDAARLSAVAQVDPAPAVQELPDFDQIPNMDEAQLRVFQKQIVDQVGAVSPLIQKQIDARFEALKFEKSFKAEVWVSPANQEKSVNIGKKVQFADDSSSDSDMPALERVTQGEHKREGAAQSPDSALVKHNAGAPRASEIPAPFNTDDFVGALAPDEDYKGSQDAQPAKEPVIGKDLQPVDTQAHPLSDTPQAASLDHQPVPAACPRSPAPEQRDVPSGQMSAVSAEQTSDLEAPESKKPDTSGDQKLAQELTYKFAAERAQTLGGSDEAPRLAVTEPIAHQAGTAHGAPASLEQVKKAAGLSDAESHEEGQTPGGPDDSDSTEQFDSGVGSCDDSRFSKLQKGLVAAAVVGLVYGTAETVFAYRSISGHEWKQTSGIVNKAKLVMGKTWENIKKRPSQLMNLAKQVPAAGSSFVAKLKAQARAA